MLTVLVQTLHESLYRRMGVVLLAVSLLIPGIYLYYWISNAERLPTGEVVLRVGPRNAPIPAEMFVRGNFRGFLEIANTLWFFLGIFAAAPLMTTFMEKGWVEMLLSKGVARWQMLLGRYVAALLVYVAALFITYVVPALYVWQTTGITQYRFLASIGITIFSFTATLALMTLLGVGQPNQALLVIVGFVQVTLSRLLAERATFYPLIPYQWVKTTIDWIYRLFPKSSELQRMATDYFAKATIESWWPFWSTGVFTVVTLTLALWVFHRKSF